MLWECRITYSKETFKFCDDQTIGTMFAVVRYRMRERTDPGSYRLGEQRDLLDLQKVPGILFFQFEIFILKPISLANISADRVPDLSQSESEIRITSSG